MMMKSLVVKCSQFDGHTVSYGPSFSPSFYGLSTKRAGHKTKGKTMVRKLTVWTKKVMLLRFIFIISQLCLKGLEMISIQGEWLQISDAPRKQNDSI